MKIWRYFCFALFCKLAVSLNLKEYLNNISEEVISNATNSKEFTINFDEISLLLRRRYPKYISNSLETFKKAWLSDIASIYKDNNLLADELTDTKDTKLRKRSITDTFDTIIALITFQISNYISKTTLLRYSLIINAALMLMILQKINNILMRNLSLKEIVAALVLFGCVAELMFSFGLSYLSIYDGIKYDVNIVKVLFVSLVSCFAVTSSLNLFLSKSSDERLSISKYNRFKNGKVNRDRLYCLICLSEQEEYLTECNHGYHLECLKKWRESDNMNRLNCPLCFKKIDKVYKLSVNDVE